MCTAITLKTKNFYFGRNLDLEYHYNESVVVTPRRYPFKFTDNEECTNHNAIIGIATVEDGYPLYYDGTNEKGLSVAGLHFPGNAFYSEYDSSSVNVAPFEFIPWLLSCFDSVKQALPVLEKLNLVNIPFSKKFPSSPLHWIISDKEQSITLEPQKDRIKIFKNTIGVLTNNPTFDFQMLNLSHYTNLSASQPPNVFAEQIPVELYSRGLGGLGLPGDLSSMSRFVRAAFTKTLSVCDDNEQDSVTRFFHILSSVAHTRGTVKVDGKNEITVYSSCCNAEKGIYYYTTYENQRISAVDMFRENLNESTVFSYPLMCRQDIFMQN